MMTNQIVGINPSLKGKEITYIYAIYILALSSFFSVFFKHLSQSCQQGLYATQINKAFTPPARLSSKAFTPLRPSKTFTPPYFHHA